MRHGAAFFTRRVLKTGLLLLMLSSWSAQTSADTSEWGQSVPGVLRRFVPKGREIALTFDACGGPKGSAVDRELLDLLRREKIPATLFISGRWLEKNEGTARELAADPLFLVANHGLNHRPLSVSGRSAYRIQGTRSPDEVRREIGENAALLAGLTGTTTTLFRSGTNHYDEAAVRLAEAMGHKVVGYTLNGDGGATSPRKRIVDGLLALTGGEIVLFHMNRPEGATFEGLRDALPELKRRGFRFILLSDRPLRP
ncbi:MAG TPA: polysaccharide deacetylase [Synergistaceae bacterium]|nr:polysaccharide deacetylase [Synergistaceae bacterium]